MIGHFLERLLTKRLSHSGVPHGSKDGEGSVQPIRPEQAVNRQVITCVRGHYARSVGWSCARCARLIRRQKRSTTNCLPCISGSDIPLDFVQHEIQVTYGVVRDSTPESMLMLRYTQLVRPLLNNISEATQYYPFCHRRSKNGSAVRVEKRYKSWHMPAHICAARVNETRGWRRSLCGLC